ncbi:UTP11-like, U3 small nucleolar ribonucleoprotein [Tritrichomonas musculus]|uniref:U3 small nucleolar RNA-associated protein 11 n=1 Tax=Tritrichomonas musculus TaxID=1915356 RepID=A0ABR2KZC0_9EUKA
MNSSKWKFPYQKNKRERQQPRERESLGFLEKKKDYLKRAERQHKKDEFIHDLKREAALRNPEEFYFSMITDTKNRSSDKVETKSKPFKKFNKEQRLLLETRNQSYILSKLQSHKNQLQRLKSRLPPTPQKPIRYFNSIEEALEAKRLEEEEESNKVEEPERPDIIELKEEIKRRQKIVKELQEVYDEMQLQKDLKDGESKAIEDEDGNISYEWKKERKK